MTIIGITGGSGAGKTTALQVLEELGALVIDCDAVYHELLETCRPMLAEIDARFPGVVEGGVLRRQALGEVVFRDPAALDDLNAITHGYVGREVDWRIARHRERGGTLAAVDAIALIESDIRDRCTAVVGVIAPAEERVRRIMAREGISREYAETRVRSQKPDTYFRENCDIILENHFDEIEDFKQECRRRLAALIRREEDEHGTT